MRWATVTTSAFPADPLLTKALHDHAMTRPRASIAVTLIACATLAAAGCDSAADSASPGSTPSVASSSTSTSTSTTTPRTDGPNHSHHDHETMSQPPLASRRADATGGERAAADTLFAQTQASLVRFANEPDAVAAGFVPAPNATGRLIHYRNVANRRDASALDPDRPEGLVYARSRSGALVLLGAVFTVQAGEAAPTPAGDIFRWHTHDPRCATFLVPAGGCPETFRMLHVWTTTSVDVVDPWIQPFRAAIGRTGPDATG